MRRVSSYVKVTGAMDITRKVQDSIDDLASASLDELDLDFLEVLVEPLPSLPKYNKDADEHGHQQESTARMAAHCGRAKTRHGAHGRVGLYWENPVLVQSSKIMYVLIVGYLSEKL